MTEPGGAASNGLVISRSRRNCVVRTVSGGERICYFRGRLEEHERPVVGDRVLVRETEDDEAILDEILPRRNTLRRVAEDDSKSRTIAANVDQVVIVLSVDPFPPRWALADRLLALCEREGFEGVVVVNKIDLARDGSRVPAEVAEIHRAIAVYESLPARVLRTSAVAGTGVDQLRELLSGRINVLSGHSGVGKSSLLNAVYPGWKLAVGAVNPVTSKGRHTTTAARLLPLPGGGHVVDTPGFREFGLGHVDAPDLGRYFREFRPFIGACRFSDCLHDHEPHCGVKRAVEEGGVSRLRYGNYLQILKGLL